MTRHRHYGQALTEMLLILPLLLLLGWASLTLGRQQQAALELRHQSRSLALARAKGLEVQGLAALQAPQAAFDPLHRPLAQPSAQARLPLLGSLQAQLGLEPLGLVGARLGVRTVSALGAPLSIHRELLTVGMPALPASSGEVRRTIEQAPLTWQQTADPTVRLALSQGQRLLRLDQAWGRAPVQDSWLRAWEDLSGE